MTKEGSSRMRKEYRKNSLLVILLILGTVSGAAAQNQEIDLIVSIDFAPPYPAADLQWFQGNPEGVYEYRLSVDGGQLGLNTILLPAEFRTHSLDLDPASDRYLISIEALDAAGQPIASSPVEEILLGSQGEGNLPNPPAESLSDPYNSSSVSGLDAILESCNSQNFPFIFISTRVEENGLPRLDLGTENFVCTEDGRLQEDFFAVFPPDEGGAVRQADIVFLIDVSGSMGGEIADVRSNVSSFAQSLGESDIDFRLGLVKFGNGSGPNPFVFNSGALTGDVPQFQGFVDTLVASGGYEPGFLAIRMAISQFQFRPGSQLVFLLISDEDSDDRNKIETLELLLANDVTVHSAVNCSSGNSNADYCTGCDPASDPLSVCSVRGATDGLLFGIQDPFGPVLEQIAERAGDSYIVRYRSDNPVFDGIERAVECTVSDFITSDTLDCAYTPGAAPRIQRTGETIALSGSAQVQGTPLTISAEVTDDVEPLVSVVTLYYRTTGTGSAYSARTMSQLGSNVWSAGLPTGAVLAPGVDYYLSATDGEVTSFDPSTDPASRPYQIAVLPNESPVMTHTPITQALPGQPLPITAELGDSTNCLAEAGLRWRRTGTLIYEAISQFPLCSTQLAFAATIPPEDVTEDGLEYYLTAVDDLGVGSSVGTADSPISVDVTGELPQAAFAVSSLSPSVGLVVGVVVQFTDESTGSPHGFEWDFNFDGIVDSTDRNPSWVFLTPGRHHVFLRVHNLYGSDSVIQDVKVEKGEWALYGTEGFNPDHPTVVITHGFQPFDDWEGEPPAWVNEMAFEMRRRLGNQLNVLRFAWSRAFTGQIEIIGPDLLVLSHKFKSANESVEENGWNLAGLLSTAVPEGYLSSGENRIQFIGHSLGSIVNLHAALALKRYPGGLRIDQFTILDAPLEWNGYDQCTFRNQLPDYPDITWVDNYYGVLVIPPCLAPGVGEKISGTAPERGKRLFRCHSGVHDWYFDTIADEEADEGFFYSAVLDENFDSRPDPKLFDRKECRFRGPELPTELGSPYPSSEFWAIATGTAYEGLAGSTPAIILAESSDSAIALDVTIPVDATDVSFDFLFLNPGDGDWLSLSFNGDVLWTFGGLSFSGSEMVHATVALGGHAGEAGELRITLHSIGSVNAEVAVSGFQFLTPPEEVVIDVKPGEEPNIVNPESMGVVPVAILTTSTALGDDIDFDATTVDPHTISFGPGAAPIAHNTGHFEDVDGDGNVDLLLHFWTQYAQISCGDELVQLTGQTLEGGEVDGIDSIRTVGCE